MRFGIPRRRQSPISDAMAMASVLIMTACIKPTLSCNIRNYCKHSPVLLRIRQTAVEMFVIKVKIARISQVIHIRLKWNRTLHGSGSPGRGYIGYIARRIQSIRACHPVKYYPVIGIIIHGLPGAFHWAATGRNRKNGKADNAGTSFHWLFLADR